VVDGLPRPERRPERLVDDQALQEQPILVVDRVIEAEAVRRFVHARLLRRVAAADCPLGRVRREEEEHERHERDPEEEHTGPQHPSQQVSPHRWQPTVDALSSRYQLIRQNGNR
jgi:hypothetical protein